MRPPTVAVVIPVRDGEGEIGPCLGAIAAQTRPPDELIVIDNGSTDGTAAEARSAGAIVLSESTPGSYVARNTGLAATMSDIVAFTDADCIPEPEWIERLLDGFVDPDVGAVGGAIVPLTEVTATERWAIERGVLDQHAAYQHAFLPYFATANVAFRRDALVAIGGFEPSLASGGDVDASWRLQMVAGYRLLYQPDARVHHRHRRHVGSLMRQYRRYARGHGRLDRRWHNFDGYEASAGTAVQRLRAVWLLPARLPARLLTGRPLSVPVIDAAIRLIHEVGRREGRRMPPLPALPPAPHRHVDKGIAHVHV